MEANDVREQDHSAPAQTETESRIIEAEQTEIAVWESLLQDRPVRADPVCLYCTGSGINSPPGPGASA